jgi:diadenosine tetraphosphate (Ap4A) HIT family hydrolase
VCPLCERVASGELVARNELAAAFPDAYPVSDGHVLIVPLRHEPSGLALSLDEQAAMLHLLAAARAWIEARFRPDGYNLGMNVGEAAGQTVAHAHLHLIPRYHGDAPDPRGGVRWVLPARAAYWSR